MISLRWGLLGAFAGGALMAFGQANLLANCGFEEGDKTPAGWSLSQGRGEWLKQGGNGDSACVTVEGDGVGDNAWFSAPLTFQPGRIYRLSFCARSANAGSGTVVSGPTFANVDIGVPGKAWTQYEQVFAAPWRKDELTAPVRFGQWQMKGRAYFDDVRLSKVEAVHAMSGDLVMGEGEKIEGNHYTFDAPFGSECRNHSRPLFGFTAHYNSERWCFSEGVSVTYRHDLAGRKLLSGTVGLECGYYVSGRLMADVSSDAKEWHHVGVLTNAGNVKLVLPAALFPADAVYVRLRGAKPPCQLQLYGYTFQGDADGAPLSFDGSTRYIETEASMPKVRVQVRGLGDAIPGGENLVELNVQNATGAPLETEARVIFSRPGENARTNAVPVAIAGSGAFELRIPYEVPGVGAWQMEVCLGDGFTARSAVRVPEFYNDAYGEVIPVNNPKLNLWRASSGWKIPQYRSLPRQIAKSLVLRVAKNEWEAVQLVVAPNEALTNVAVSVSDLAFGKSRIPAADVQVLRVGYVPVTQTTDSAGTRAAWPDPLLPQGAEPVTVEAGRNQPYWIRVRASKDLPAGIYRGTVTVQAEGVKVTAVLNVEVYDFALPDTLTCETAFGFNPETVWRYHKVTDPVQRRGVLDAYLRSLGEHRLSPYNPAPMDGWSVTWKGLCPWRGGVIDTKEKAEGKSSLFVNDASEQDNCAAVYREAVTLPKKGFKVAFKHKTDRPHPFLFSVNYLRADGAWMSGRNTDIVVEGKTEWQSLERVLNAFPSGAASCRFSIYAAGYQEQGTGVGGLWLDALSVTDAATGQELVEGGSFEPADAKAVTPVFDWAAWDAAMELAFATNRFNTFQMQIEGLGGGTFHARHEPVFLGYPESSPEYDILFGKYLKGIETHLREKGWLDKAFVYWFDEPDPKDYAFVTNGFAKLKRHAPGLRRMLTEQVEKDLAEGPNVWCPLTPSLNVEGLEERRAAGDQFWWYICCSPKAPYATEFIDHPGTELRVWLWQTWAERVSGILIWETVWWTSDTAYPDPASPQNPYLDPMSWTSGYGVAKGSKRPWGNGDGRFLYPPLAAANGKPSAPVLEGPVESLRLEMLRDGIEDYEYFVILKRLLAEKGAKLDSRTRMNVETLLKVPAEVSAGLTHFTKDPITIETHRDKLARAIVDLLKL